MLNKTFSTPVLTSALFTPNKEMICNFRNDVDPTNINKSASGFIDDINYEEILKKVPNTEHYLPLVVRAVSAGEYYGPNDKWDFFPEQELKDHYETFLTAHVFFNHDNKDVRKACGPVYDAYYDTKMHCVILVMAVDLSKEGETAKAVRNGYLTDVSMGCGAGYVSCPLCKTIAYKPTMRCEHLKNNLGQIIDNQLIYEITHKPKFYDISLVLNGADRTAKIYHVIQKAASLLPYCNTQPQKPQEAINLKPKKLDQKELNLAIRKEAVASYLNSITEPIQKTSYELLKTKKEASLPVLQNLHNLIQSLNPNKSEMHITISLAKKGRNGTFLTPNELHTLLRGKPLEADYENTNPDLWLNPGETLLDILDEPFKKHVDVFRAVRKVKPWAISSITPEDEIETGIEIPDILNQLIPTIQGTKNVFPSTDPSNFRKTYQTYIILLPSLSDPKNLTEEEIKELEGSLMPDETKLEHLAKDSIKVKVSQQDTNINKEAGVVRRTLIGTPLIYGLSGYYKGKEQEGGRLNTAQQAIASAPVGFVTANTLYGPYFGKLIKKQLGRAKDVVIRGTEAAIKSKPVQTAVSFAKNNPKFSKGMALVTAGGLSLGAGASLVNKKIKNKEYWDSVQQGRAQRFASEDISEFDKEAMLDALLFVDAFTPYHYEEEDNFLTKVASESPVTLEEDTFLYSFIKAAALATYEANQELAKEARDAFVEVAEVLADEEDERCALTVLYKQAMEDQGEEIMKEAFTLSSLPFDFMTYKTPVKALVGNAAFLAGIAGASLVTKGVSKFMDYRRKKNRSKLLAKTNAVKPISTSTNNYS